MLQCVSPLKAVCWSLLHCMTKPSKICCLHSSLTYPHLRQIQFCTKNNRKSRTLFVHLCRRHIRFNYMSCLPSHSRNASFAIDANIDVFLSFSAFEDAIVLNLVGCALMIMCLSAVAIDGEFGSDSSISIHKKDLSLFSDSFCIPPIGGDNWLSFCV